MSEHPLIRVLTVNVNGYEPYGDRNPVLREGIIKLQPDVLSFQEAAYLPGKQHQIAECLDGLGYQIDHQFDGLDTPPGGTGNCIASRWPMERVALVPLPATPRSGNYPVAVLCDTVHAPEPLGDFLFVNPKPNWQLHLEKEREQQVVAIARLVEEYGDPDGLPPIVAADFDASPDNASIRFMTGKQSLDGCSTHFLDAWDIAGDSTAGYTWTSDNPFNQPIIDRYIGGNTHRRRIDYIFVGSPFLFAKPVQIKNCKVVLDKPINGIYASGHFGVYAEISGTE